jgi:N-acyl-D-aspartate/D-glutamate deacylase
MACDLKLLGGEVIDGTGAPAFRADVAITGDRISATGELSGLEAAQTIDCTGKTVTPGFIDIHSHADWLVPWSDHGTVIEPFIRQGMTSVVAGNCGFSPAPVTDRNRQAIYEAGRLFSDGEVDIRWETMAEFLTHLEQNGLALNICELVGHGAVRSAVKGPMNPETPTRDELVEMERLTKQALDDGAIGVSMGLQYAPGIFADEPELETFASWSARDGKLLTSHLKAYSWISPAYKVDPAVSPHNVEAIEEMMRVARAADARLQLSHLIFVGRTTWPTHSAGLRAIERAREDGLDVAFDAFPYTAGNTRASVLVPREMLPRLAEIFGDPEQLAGIRALGDAIFPQIGFNLGDIQIMNANAPGLTEFNGLFIPEAAERAGMEIWEFYGRLILESKDHARILIHTYSGDEKEEEALRAVLAHPLCTMETDTLITLGGHQNPASYGTFPRVLSTYVREGLFGLEEAVHKMTGASASRLNWTDRGWVRKGCAADLIVLDTATLQDTATFEEPARTPVGIDHVFINGRHVVDGEVYDPAAAAGRVLRA